MMFVAFGVGWIIYHTSWSRIVNTPDLSIDQLAGIFDTVNHILIRWVVVFGVVIAILSIFVSHKIAGPVYRLEETTRVIASGDLTYQVHLRHGDELKDLQEAFNQMSEKLRTMVANDRKVIERLIASTESLRDAVNSKKQSPEAVEKVASELNDIVAQLQDVTSAFKIEEDQLESESDSDSDSAKDEQQTA